MDYLPAKATGGSVLSAKAKRSLFIKAGALLIQNNNFVENYLRNLW